MKKIIMFFIGIFFLSGCSSNPSMEIFSFDTRTKDVALENVVLVSSGNKAYLQPTFQVFRIENLSTGENETIRSVVIKIYDETKNLIYSTGIGENQKGILDTRTDSIEGELIGTVLNSKHIKDGKKLYVEFVYEKNGIEVKEEVEVELNRE
jgi:hypothetical protein